ncbi:DUF72 domain-containing protein [Parapedobacter tibetensis]|uniref:DUF72 domain-containing protein n=1 Tax=Parapedobacter tibetensis TaxID=2972951 RepID=UPI00214D6888|nr:DUF72 domain-containing protein [Parapedobacter tibetensis]
MKFGSVDNPEAIDFTLPPTHPDTTALLGKHKMRKDLEVFVGCAKWNKQDLKGFYPRGTKDELVYYATQFNSIELNGTFYNSPDKQQVETWKSKTPADFKFFPKVPQSISHYGRLLNVDEKMTAFADAITLFEEKLGVSFLQLHDNFKPKDFDRLATFVKKFAKSIPLAVEVRNSEWFSDESVRVSLYQLLEEQQVANVLVDTAGRRDMLHMRLTTPSAFVRYVGANHPTDYKRLDDWITRISEWRDAGLQSLYFFVHQNIEVESPLLSTYFVDKLNRDLGLQVKGPVDLQAPKNSP